MKKIIAGVAIIFIVPQIAFASWWNPTTWQIFKKNVTSPRQITPNSTATSTDKNNSATETSNIIPVVVSTSTNKTIEPSSPNGSLVRSLSIGMEGSDVSELQALLARDKSVYPEGRVTGIFDIATKKAVQRFQDKYNLADPEQKLTPNYGAVGPKTLKVLKDVLGESKTVTPTKKIEVNVVKNTPIKTSQQSPSITNQNQQGDTKNSDSSLVTVKIISPNGGEEFYMGGVMPPIKLSVSGLPSNAEKMGYSIRIGFKGLPFGSRVNLPTKVSLTNSPGREFPWQIQQPDDNLSDEWSDFEFGKMTVEVERFEKKEFTAQEIKTMESSGINPNTVPPRYVGVVVASDESDGNVKVYKTTKSLIEKMGGYKQQGSITLGKGNIFDVWGGRFLIRLDSLTGSTANFTTLFDNIPNGTLKVPLGQSTPVALIGTDTSSSYRYSGQITYKNIVIDNLGNFDIKMDTDTPVDLAPPKPIAPAPAPKTISLADPSGLATLNVTPVAGSKFTVKISGTYNLLSKICTQTQYFLGYGDGKSDTLSTLGDCGAVIYSKTHVYSPGTYSINIDWYNPEPAGWMHYTQASRLITVSSTGEVKVQVINPSSIIKG